MFYSTDPHDRVGFITALRDLAAFLDANPRVPVPCYGTLITLHADSYEDGGQQQVDHIACLLDAAITDRTPNGHYTASRSFGGITYEAASIPATWRAMRDAQCSYETSITVDQEISS